MFFPLPLFLVLTDGFFISFTCITFIDFRFMGIFIESISLSFLFFLFLLLLFGMFFNLNIFLFQSIFLIFNVILPHILSLILLINILFDLFHFFLLMFFGIWIKITSSIRYSWFKFTLLFIFIFLLNNINQFFVKIHFNATSFYLSFPFYLI